MKGLCLSRGKVLSSVLLEKAFGDIKKKIRQTGDRFLQVTGKNHLTIKGKSGGANILEKTFPTLGFSGRANITPM